MAVEIEGKKRALLRRALKPINENAKRVSQELAIPYSDALALLSLYHQNDMHMILNSRYRQTLNNKKEEGAQNPDKMPSTSDNATLSHGTLTIRMKVVARDPCPEHGYPHTEEKLADGSWIDEYHDCAGGIVGYQDSDDLSCNALAQLIQINIMALAAQTVLTVSNSAQAVSVGDIPSAPVVVAGVHATPAVAFTDYALADGTTNTDYHTASAYCHAATINAIASNTFTVTGTIQNASTAKTYTEVGIAVTLTHSASPYYFLLTHDQVNSGTGYLVSATGTLAITGTGTFT